MQSYGPSNTYTWTPTAADVGSNAVRVSVRNAGSHADFDDTATLPLRVVEGEFGFAPDVPVSLGVHFGALAATALALPRRHSLYSPELQLLAETEVTTASKPPVEYEYIWFAGEPLAQITTSTNEIHWYFNDHLGTPILQTASDATIVWRVEYDPYGSVFAHRAAADKHQPLRFPGQEHDGASELTYNVFRWYRAGWGRYTQADPLMTHTLGGKLVASDLIDVYRYASANPETHVDPRGLQKCKSGDCPDCPSGWWTLVSASLTVHGFFGGEAGTIALRCVGKPKMCRYWFWCFNIGPGAEVSIGATGGVVGPAPGCKCAENFSGWGIGLEVSGGKEMVGSVGGIGTSPGSCFAAWLGAGVGAGAAVKASAYCSTTLIGCDS